MSKMENALKDMKLYLQQLHHSVPTPDQQRCRHLPRILKQSKRNGVGSPGDDLCIVLRDGEEEREFFEEKGGEREREKKFLFPARGTIQWKARTQDKLMGSTRPSIPGFHLHN